MGEEQQKPFYKNGATFDDDYYEIDTISEEDEGSMDIRSMAFLRQT